MSGPLACAESEEALVCALALQPQRTEEVKGLRLDHFFFDQNREVLRAVLALKKHGAPVDAASLASLLKRWRRLEGIGGTPAIAEILAAPVIENLRWHADQIIEFARRRKLRDLCDEVEQELIRGELSADDALARLKDGAP